ncbi:MAG TPA: hypothetical protein VGW76_08245 [Pyrinomonadaceae bacterium]|nr:hypothetical protein [Pyrinomonadaceae bacterium]
MKSKPSILVLVAALALMLTAQIQAQTNPPYLAQFPSPDRIKADVRGVDAMDTAAKQAGIFWQLRQLISLLAYSQKRIESQFTPDEQRMEPEYRSANYFAMQPFEGKVTGADKTRWFELHTKYEGDLWLRDEVFKKYFTPELRRTVYSMLKVPVPTGSAPPGSTLQPSAAPASSNGSSTDSSIASANEVRDRTVAGMELGKRLLLPDCNNILWPGAATCNLKGFNLGIDRETGQEKRLGGTLVRTVRLAEDNCPSWVRNCDAYVMMQDGTLMGVFFLTPGRNVEKAVGEELRAKYGTLLLARAGTFTPDVGNPFKFTDLEWFLPGLHVEYNVLRKLEDEERANGDEGIVWIELESVYQRRMADKKKPAKRKL